MSRSKHAALGLFLLITMMASSKELCAALITTGPIEWSISTGGNGHWYELVMPDIPLSGLSWTDSKAAAESAVLFGANGHLATVTSGAENEFLRVNFSSLLRSNGPGFVGDFAWIGLSDAVQEGNFQWVTGETFSYSNWHFTEPNNIGGAEDYVHYWVRDGAFSWNDEDNTDFAGFPGTLQGYFVEFDGPFEAVPEPASALVWSMLASAFLLTRQRHRRPRELKH